MQFLAWATLPPLSTSLDDDSATASAPGSLRLLGRVASHAWQQARAEGVGDGLRVLLGAGRVLRARELLAELFAIPAFARLMAAQPQEDVLFFINHRHFLSREFGTAERMACVLDHFRFEQSHFSPALLPALHGDGLVLWSHPSGCQIRLVANAHTRHEGPISLVLHFAGRPVHELSMACVDASRLDARAPAEPVLFVTRSQSVPPDAPALALFRGAFPQNSPGYFVLAALHGVAAALGQQRVVGVRGACQIAFEPALQASFKRSYDEFWMNFGGRPLGRHGLEMPVPAAVAPLQRLKAKHRARARQRRAHWGAIAQAAEQALSPYLKP